MNTMRNTTTLFATLLTAGAALLCVSNVTAGTDQNRHSRFMAYFDSNNDNVVTLEELNSASATRFKSMDTNADNRVSPEEFSAYVAQLRQDWMKKRLTEFDTNSDGVISKDEYLSYKMREAEQRFNELDSDKDQSISAEEFMQRRARHFGAGHRHRAGEGIFAKLDANNDGELTLEESLNAWTNWFNRIDANADQVVTAEEVRNFRGGMQDK